MNIETNLFDREDAGAEPAADARAEADVRAGLLIGHGSVRRWLTSWGKAKPLPRPRAGD